MKNHCTVSWTIPNLQNTTSNYGDVQHNIPSGLTVLLKSLSACATVLGENLFNVFSSGNERYAEFGKGSFSALMVIKSLNERFDIHNQLSFTTYLFVF